MYHISVVDNNRNKWGNMFCGYEIQNPDIIKNVEYSKVILAIMGGWMSVYKQLTDMGVKENDIIHAIGWSSLDYYNDELDEYFEVKKKEFIPFERIPVVSLGHCGGETSKAYNRRQKEKFFERFCKGEGLDIGCGNDVVIKGCYGWDLAHGDAQYLATIEDESLDYVYSSHCLEHMVDVRVALKNWFRVLRKGGYLLLYIPERDLYEKRKRLPSRFNPHHRHMFKLGQSDEFDTLDIIEEIKESLDGYEIIYAKICDDGYEVLPEHIQSSGEYSIEIVLQKIIKD